MVHKENKVITKRKEYSPENFRRIKAAKALNGGSLTNTIKSRIGGISANKKILSKYRNRKIEAIMESIIKIGFLLSERSARRYKLKSMKMGTTIFRSNSVANKLFLYKNGYTDMVIINTNFIIAVMICNFLSSIKSSSQNQFTADFQYPFWN